MSNQPKTRLEEELEFLDSRIKDEEAKMVMNNDLEELFKLDSFKRVMLEAYMEDEADRITSAITTPDGMKKEHIDTLLGKLVSIRNLRAFLEKIGTESHFAKETLQELKETRDDVKANPSKYFDTEED